MAKVVHKTNDNKHMVFCKACKCGHAIGSGWTFNGDYEKPTFSPSILVRSGHYMPEYKQGNPCWCTYNAEHPDDPSPFKCFICHSFVEDGIWKYLNDCTHEFAGQNIPLEEF